MTDAGVDAISETIEAVERGEPEAASHLLPLVYAQLRQVARQMMGDLPPGQTLQPTALVHEAYLKVASRKGEGWEGRRHFFGAASRAMRDILVDQARRKAALKRGGDRIKLELKDELAAIEDPRGDILALSEKLEELETDDPRKAEIVNLRFFSGLSIAEVASVIGISEPTVKREWRFARAWLRTVLGDGTENERPAASP